MPQFPAIIHPVCGTVRVAVAVVGLVAFAPRVARGAEPLISAVGGSGPVSVSFTLGWEFTTGSQPLRLTSLGVWDSNGDGLAGSHAVGVWNATATLLGQATVPAGSVGELDASYRYADLLSPIDLAPNTTYLIAGSYSSNDPYRFFSGFGGDSANEHVNGGITVGSGRNEPGTALAFPTGTTSAVYTGPNARFVVVPEPSSACAVLASLAGVVACRRSRLPSTRPLPGKTPGPPASG